MEVEYKFDVSKMRIPTEEIPRVDRTAYLNYGSDSDKVKDLK